METVGAVLIVVAAVLAFVVNAIERHTEDAARTAKQSSASLESLKAMWTRTDDA